MTPRTKNYSFQKEQSDGKDLLVMKYTGFMTTEDFKSSFTDWMSIIKNKKITRMLVDGTAQKVLSAEAAAWLQENFIPLTEQCVREAFGNEKVFRCAYVQSKDLFSKIQTDEINKMVSQAGLSYDYKMMGDLEEARKWLSE